MMIKIIIIIKSVHSEINYQYNLHIIFKNIFYEVHNTLLNEI